MNYCYSCCNCQCPYFLNSCTHKVLGFAKDDNPSGVITDPEVVILEVEKPCAVDGEKFNIRFCGQVPSGLDSPDMYVEINDETIPLQNACGNKINTSVLRGCDILCGIYVGGRCPFLKIYRIC